MKELKTNIKFLSIYFKSSKRLLIINIILNILLIITSVVLPILSAKIIAELTNSNLKKVLYIAIVLVLIRIFSTMLNFFRYSSNYKIYNNILSNLRKDSLKRMHLLKNQTLDNNSVGLFVKRIKNDTETISITYWRISNDIKSIISTICIFIAILIKITGIAFLSEFAVSICKDSGEAAIASKIEIGSKIIIISMSIPIISNLLEIILKILP